MECNREKVGSMSSLETLKFYLYNISQANNLTKKGEVKLPFQNAHNPVMVADMSESAPTRIAFFPQKWLQTPTNENGG